MYIFLVILLFFVPVMSFAEPTTGSSGTEDGTWEFNISSSSTVIGDIDFPWGYSRPCGPSPSFNIADCIGAYYWNIPSPSSIDRVSPFLPAFRSLAVEHSYNESGTNNDWYYEQNEEIQFAMVDASVTASGGAFTAGNYVTVGPLGTYADWQTNLAKIISWTPGTPGTLRLNWQLTTTSPASGDTIREITSATSDTPTGVTATWPASSTEQQNSYRLRFQETDMSNDSMFWAWYTPSGTLAPGVSGPTDRIFWIGRGTNTFRGIGVNNTEALNDMGGKIAGKLDIIEAADASSATVQASGVLRLRNTDGGSIQFAVNKIGSTVGTPTLQVTSSTEASGSAVALVPDILVSSIYRTGIMYMHLSDDTYTIGGVAVDTGDELCAAIGSRWQCRHVIDYGASGANTIVHKACTDDIVNNNYFSASCSNPN